jgi:hypothetical protein
MVLLLQRQTALDWTWVDIYVWGAACLMLLGFGLVGLFMVRYQVASMRFKWRLAGRWARQQQALRIGPALLVLLLLSPKLLYCLLLLQPRRIKQRERATPVALCRLSWAFWRRQSRRVRRRQRAALAAVCSWGVAFLLYAFGFTLLGTLGVIR